jgi:hypothetical protein
MYVLNFARGDTQICSSRDEAIRLFFSCSSYNDYFECKKAVLMRMNDVLFVLDDVKLPRDCSFRFERVVLTESIHDVRQAIQEFVSDRVRAELIRVEANTFNMFDVLEALTNNSASHARVRVDYLDNEYINSF